MKYVIKVMLLLLLLPIFIATICSSAIAKDYVYLKMNNQVISGDNLHIPLLKGASYYFEAWGSKDIECVKIYIHNTELYAEGSKPSITFIPQEEKTYELDLIGYDSKGVRKASQKVYLEVTAGGTGSNCVELWECKEWGPCENGEKTRQCEDKNKCGTNFYKPKDREKCEDNGKEPDKPSETKCKEYSPYTLNDNFYMGCKNLECNNKKMVYKIKSKDVKEKTGLKEVEIGFIDVSDPKNQNYYQDIKKDMLIALYNKKDNNIYIYFGQEVNKELEKNFNKEDFKADPCNGFLKTIHKIEGGKVADNLVNNNVMIVTTSEVVNDLGNTFEEYIDSLKMDNYDTLVLVLDKVDSIKVCDDKFNKAIKPPIEPEYSIPILKKCIDTNNIKYVVILGGYNDIKQVTKEKDETVFIDGVEKIEKELTTGDVLLFYDEKEFENIYLVFGRIPRGIDKDKYAIKNYLEKVAIPLHKQHGIKKKDLLNNKYAWLMRVGIKNYDWEEMKKKQRPELIKLFNSIPLSWIDSETIVYRFFGNKICNDNENCDLSPPQKKLRKDFENKPYFIYWSFHGSKDGEQRNYDEDPNNYGPVFTPEDVDKSDVWNSVIVSSSSCYAARIHNVRFDESLVLKILANGALGYTGKTIYNTGLPMSKEYYDSYINGRISDFLSRYSRGIFFKENKPERIIIYELFSSPEEVLGDIVKKVYFIESRKWENDEEKYSYFYKPVLENAFYGDPTIRIKNE